MAPEKRYKFLVDTNFGLPVHEAPWTDLFDKLDIEIEETVDLPYIQKQMQKHIPDLSFIPSADYWRLLRKGDTHYRGLVLPTSKYTGETSLPSVLVVKKDDPATKLLDLEGASYGYINQSCTSSYFPPAVMLVKHAKSMHTFLKAKPVKIWQGQIDAVVAGEVRATMCPEDVWSSKPENAKKTKIIDRWASPKGGFIVVRDELNETVCNELQKALVRWNPPFTNLYGPFRPFYLADVYNFFHELDSLPEDF